MQTKMGADSSRAPGPGGPACVQLFPVRLSHGGASHHDWIPPQSTANSQVALRPHRRR